MTDDAELIGYAETPIRIAPVHWAPGPNDCASCGVSLTPETTAQCAAHPTQTCRRCDADLIHERKSS